MSTRTILAQMRAVCDRFDTGQIASPQLRDEIDKLAGSLENLGAEPAQVARQFRENITLAEAHFGSSKTAGLRGLQDAIRTLRSWIDSRPTAN
jgi:hypothetical protein